LRFSFVKNIRCENSLICSNTLLAQLETHLGLILHAETGADKVEGSLTIFHDQGFHKIKIVVNEIAQGRLIVPAIIPTQEQVNLALETTISSNSIFTRVRKLLRL